MIAAYSTIAGARRRRREVNGCIIRVLCEPDHMFIVVPSFLGTQIMSVDETGKADGSISLMGLATRHD